MNIEYRTNTYTTTNDTPNAGDLVMTNEYGVWKFRQAPCPMPYWGNANACKKIVAVDGVEVNDDNKENFYDLQYKNFKQ